MNLLRIQKGAPALADGLSATVKTMWEKRLKDSNKIAYSRRIQLLKEKLDFQKGISILDIGCGLGSDIAELLLAGADCYGVDIWTDALKLVYRISEKLDLDLVGIHSDSQFLPFRNSRFDVVMSNQFFEHVPNLDLALKEQVRVLKKGGKLVIMQSNLLSPLSLFDLLVRYPWRSKGRFGGLKWLLTKGKVKLNYFDNRWSGKDEDIHSRAWWRRKIMNYRSIRVEEFSSLAEESWGKLVGRLFGDILILCRKVRSENLDS